MPLSVTNTITDFQKMGIKFIRRPDLNSSKIRGSRAGEWRMDFSPCEISSFSIRRPERSDIPAFAAAVS